MNDINNEDVTQVSVPVPDNPDDRIARFVDLTAQKRELDEAVKSIAAERAAVMAAIVNDFQSTATQSVKRNGWLVHLRRDLSVRVLDRAGLAEALCHVPYLRFLLGVQSQRLDSFLRDVLMREDLGTWEIDESRLPAELQGAVKMEEYYSVGCRRA